MLPQVVIIITWPQHYHSQNHFRNDIISCLVYPQLCGISVFRPKTKLQFPSREGSMIPMCQDFRHRLCLVGIIRKGVMVQRRSVLFCSCTDGSIQKKKQIFCSHEQFKNQYFALSLNDVPVGIKFRVQLIPMLWMLVYLDKFIYQQIQFELGLI